MSFSGIAVEQRSKEAKALRFFLAYSLIGSLGLHIAVLSLWTSNVLTRVPNRELEPIDIVIVDSTTPSEPKPPLEKKEETKKESELGSVSGGNIHTGSARGSGMIALSGGGNGATDVLPPSQPRTVASDQAPSPSRVIAQKQPQLATVPVQKLSDDLKTSPERVRSTRTTEATEKLQPARQLKPVETESKAQIFESSKPVKTSPHVVATKLESTPIKPARSSKPEPNPQSNLGSASDSSPQPQETKEQGSEKLTQQLRGLRDFRASKGNAGNSADSGRIDGGDRSTFAVSSGRSVGTGSGTGTRVGTGNGTGSSTGTRVGTGNGTGSGTGSKSGSNERGNGETSAIESGNGNGRGNSSGDGNGRAACRECRSKYPESARRRGIEGKVEVAVDTDEKGHVTNVRLAHSSGNRDLDEETLKQARDWKLKPATGGRRGVAIATEYAIEGSRRQRELQERTRHRVAQQRNQKTTADNPNSTEEVPTRRRRRIISGTLTDVPPEATTRHLESTSSSDGAATRPVDSTGRRLRRQSVTTDTPRDSSSATSNSRQSLREPQSQHRHQSVPSDPPRESPVSTTGRRSRQEQATTSNQSSLRESLRRYRQQTQSPSAAPPATVSDH